MKKILQEFQKRFGEGTAFDLDYGKLIILGLLIYIAFFNSPLKKALLTGFHSTAKHNATKAVSPSSETMRTI